MIPIFEQGEGIGIGHSYDSFLKKIIDICENHISSGQAKAFAFIFYDFRNNHIRDILKNQGGFARLDRLSGKELSIFYLHSDSRKSLKKFNNIFFKAFEIENTINLPFVLFFKVNQGDVTDIQIIELEQESLMFAFDELFSTIDDYLKIFPENEKNKINLVVRFVNRVKRITVDKLIEWVLSEGVKQTDNYF